MFPPDQPRDNNNGLVGLAIKVHEPCPRCRGHDASIGNGRGPHKASIMCVCGRHLGWMSIATFDFVAEIVRLFGRLDQPISVRKPSATTAEAKSSSLPCNRKGTEHGR
jgi:hypothetical protein